MEMALLQCSSFNPSVHLGLELPTSCPFFTGKTKTAQKHAKHGLYPKTCACVKITKHLNKPKVHGSAYYSLVFILLFPFIGFCKCVSRAQVVYMLVNLFN